jgi:hypothetical protein
MTRGCHAERPVQQSFAIDGCLTDDSPLEDVFAVWVTRREETDAAIAEHRATHKRTDELVPGDRLLMPRTNDGEPIVKVVRDIVDSGYVNRNELTIWTVRYEPADNGWSDGNTGIDSTWWTLAP